MTLPCSSFSLLTARFWCLTDDVLIVAIFTSPSEFISLLNWTDPRLRHSSAMFPRKRGSNGFGPRSAGMQITLARDCTQLVSYMWTSIWEQRDWGERVSLRGLKSVWFASSDATTVCKTEEGLRMHWRQKVLAFMLMGFGPGLLCPVRLVSEVTEILKEHENYLWVLSGTKALTWNIQVYQAFQQMICELLSKSYQKLRKFKGSNF